MSSQYPAERERPMYFPPSQWSARFGVQFFTVFVTEFQLFRETTKKKNYAAFKIVVSRGKQTVTVWRRYSEFDMLQRHLQLYPSERIQRVACEAPLPNKTLFRKLKADFLERRRLALEQYLQFIVGKDRRVIEVPIVRQFLQFDLFIEAPWWHPDPGEEHPYGRQTPPEDEEKDPQDAEKESIVPKMAECALAPTTPDRRAQVRPSPTAPLRSTNTTIKHVASEECLSAMIDPTTFDPTTPKKSPAKPRISSPPPIPEHPPKENMETQPDIVPNSSKVDADDTDDDAKSPLGSSTNTRHTPERKRHDDVEPSTAQNPNLVRMSS